MKTLSLIIALLLPTTIFAENMSLDTILEGVCRVTAPSGRGSGTVIKETDNGDYLILTNYHVVDNHTSVGLEFFQEGYKSVTLPGTVIFRAYRENFNIDMAIVKVKGSYFGDYSPTIIPLASQDFDISNDLEIKSGGCPRATWAKGWIGRVTDASKPGLFKFIPASIPGQSGSAIIADDPDGNSVVIGLLTWKFDNQGGAQSIQQIYNITQNTSDTNSKLPAKYKRAEYQFFIGADGRRYKNTPHRQTQCPGGSCPRHPPWRPAPKVTPNQPVPDIFPDRPKTNLKAKIIKLERLIATKELAIGEREFTIAGLQKDITNGKDKIKTLETSHQEVVINLKNELIHPLDRASGGNGRVVEQTSLIGTGVLASFLVPWLYRKGKEKLKRKAPEIGEDVIMRMLDRITAKLGLDDKEHPKKDDLYDHPDYIDPPDYTAPGYGSLGHHPRVKTHPDPPVYPKGGSPDPTFVPSKNHIPYEYVMSVLSDIAQTYRDDATLTVPELMELMRQKLKSKYGKE